MKNPNILLTCSVIIFASLAPLTGLSQISSFSTTNQFSGSGTAIWDANLIYAVNYLWVDFTKGFQGVATNTSLACTALITTDGGGRLRGGGATQMWLIEDETRTNVLSGTYDSKGSIRSAGRFTRVAGTIKATTLNGANRAISGCENYAIIFDSRAGQYSVHLSNRLTEPGLGTLSETYKFGPYPIPAQFGDGSWTLVLNVTNPVSNKLSGTATLSLLQGRVFPFLISGVVGPDTAVRRLHLKGYDEASGSFLNLALNETQIERLSGRVSGQWVQYPPAPQPQPPNSAPQQNNPSPGGSAGEVDEMRL